MPPTPGTQAPPSKAARPPALPAPRESPPEPTIVTPLPQPPSLTASRIARYIPSRAKDRPGWAKDIAVAFHDLGIAASEENICGVVAITEQESLFVADPPVPGLSKIVWKEIESRRSRYGVPRLVLDHALEARSPDGRSYRRRIDALRTEKEMNRLYQDMIGELPFGPLLLADRNPVRTGGPMQVSIAFAERHASAHGYPYRIAASIRDEVFTRRGGMYFGIAILMDYPAPYDDPLFRFADFNAGRYASRNAAFQQALAQISRASLVPDGDLLRYRGGQPDDAPSRTRLAIDRILDRLDLSARQVDRELRLEKSSGFADTELYRRVFRLAEARHGKPLPRAVIPRIRLKSPKITRELTTEWFARRVRWRYDNCRQRG
ncbi:MAG: DUF1615 domain-containing protein [Rhodocyclaceae bacterium]|nr:DUF1615 domain-containing protein [Rhodocyclaceae bacterium]